MKIERMNRDSLPKCFGCYKGKTCKFGVSLKKLHELNVKLDMFNEEATLAKKNNLPMIGYSARLAELSKEYNEINNDICLFSSSCLDWKHNASNYRSYKLWLYISLILSIGIASVMFLDTYISFVTSSISYGILILFDYRKRKKINTSIQKIVADNI